MSEGISSTGETTHGDVNQATELNEDQQELSRILKNLRHDPTLLGILSLGKDGVMRSLTADRDVVDAVALRPGLILAMLNRMPWSQSAEDDFRGVDGTVVPREHWFNPDKDLLPPPLSEENKEEARKMIEEHDLINKEKKIMEEKDLPNASRKSGGCGPVVRSNHNLEPKI